MSKTFARWQLGLLALLLVSCTPAGGRSAQGAASGSSQQPAPGSSEAQTVDAGEAQVAGSTFGSAAALQELVAQEYATSGRGLHDVVPDGAGWVWYTDQAGGALGGLNPATGESAVVPLGGRSAPHGVIIGPDGAAWVTDGGQNAIVRVDPGSLKVRIFPLPKDAPPANLNTAAFDGAGVLWFTGQNGIYGRLDPKQGVVEVFPAPRGRGPYGI